MISQSTAERFWSKVTKRPGCWGWSATKTVGYGMLSVDGTMRLAHRISYELARGPIPEGLHIDHLCRTPECTNPDHLEAVPQRINTMRGVGACARNARKMSCPHGHQLIRDNILPGKIGHRRCRTCQLNRRAAIAVTAQFKAYKLTQRSINQ